MPREKRSVPIANGYVMGEEEVEAVTRVLRTGLGPGENVARFEARCSELMGHPHGVMVNTGSSALMLAMRLLDLPQGSEVLTSVLTFSTDVSSIVFAGYVPAFVDCEIDTYQIDVDAIERMIGPKTRALLVPNLMGGMPDWDRLREIADRHDLVLIEDTCDTMGGSFRGRPPGERADMSVTSFSLHHIITCMGNGGMVCVNDPELWDRALTLRGWGRSSEPFLFGTRQGDSDGRFIEEVDRFNYDQMFVFNELGYGFLPSEAGAAFGLVQLERLPEMVRRRNQVFDRHLDFLHQHLDFFLPPRVLDGVETSWINFPFQIRRETGRRNRDLLMHLDDNGVFTRVVFSGNMTRQPMMRSVEYRADPAGYPNADQIMQFGNLLPCSAEVGEEDCEYIYEVLEEFIDG